MTDRPFADEAQAPTDRAVEAALGPAFGRYRALLALAPSFDRSWGFSKSGGWMLKVADRQKALFYLIPLHDGFRLSLTVREGERSSLLEDREAACLHDRLEAAKRYPEGFALAFDIGADPDDGAPELFVRKLAGFRGQ